MPPRGAGADPARESAALVLIGIHLSQANASAAKRAYVALHERSTSGDLPAARRAIDAALDADPLHENAVRALIGIHRSAGDQGEAIRTHFRFRDRWSDAFGLEPSELEALLGWLVTRNPRDTRAA